MILIVENDEHVRDVTAVILRSGGYEVSLAANGKEALDILDNNNKVRLVLTDLRMPVMDGPTLISVMRSDPKLAAVPVVAMTGSHSSGYLPPGIRLLHKPFRMHVLLDAVDDAQRGAGVISKRPSTRPAMATPTPG